MVFGPGLYDITILGVSEEDQNMRAEFLQISELILKKAKKLKPEIEYVLKQSYAYPNRTLEFR